MEKGSATPYALWEIGVTIKTCPQCNKHTKHRAYAKLPPDISKNEIKDYLTMDHAAKFQCSDCDHMWKRYHVESE